MYICSFIQSFSALSGNYISLSIIYIYIYTYRCPRPKSY